MGQLDVHRLREIWTRNQWVPERCRDRRTTQDSFKAKPRFKCWRCGCQTRGWVKLSIESPKTISSIINVIKCPLPFGGQEKLGQFDFVWISGLLDWADLAAAWAVVEQFRWKAVVLPNFGTPSRVLGANALQTAAATEPGRKWPKSQKNKWTGISSHPLTMAKFVQVAAMFWKHLQPHTLTIPQSTAIKKIVENWKLHPGNQTIKRSIHYHARTRTHFCQHCRISLWMVCDMSQGSHCWKFRSKRGEHFQPICITHVLSVPYPYATVHAFACIYEPNFGCINLGTQRSRNKNDFWHEYKRL